MLEITIIHLTFYLIFIHNYHQRIALINGVENARAIPNAITAIAKAMATLITGLVFASISNPSFKWIFNLVLL